MPNETKVDAIDSAVDEALAESEAPETTEEKTSEATEETGNTSPDTKDQAESTGAEKDEFESDMVKYKGKMIPYERFHKLNLSRKEALKAQQAWQTEKADWAKKGDAWKAFAKNFRSAIQDDPELDEIFSDAFVKGEMDYAKLAKAIDKRVKNKPSVESTQEAENEFRDPRVDGLLNQMKQREQKEAFDREVNQYKGFYAGDLKKLKGEFKELGNTEILGDFLERFELMAASYDESKLPTLYDAGKQYVARVRKQREALFSEQDKIANTKKATRIPEMSGPSGKSETGKLPDNFNIFGDDAARILADEVDRELSK